MRRLLTVVSAAAIALPIFAAPPPPPAPIMIHRAIGPITIDGDLSDPGWKDAARVDTFYETSPGDNTPPKVKTTAWLSYDDRFFYIGVRCDDPNPKLIRAPYVDRDLVIGTDDNIAILLDTRNDKRTAMELRVNPRGIQADGIYNDSGQIEDFSPDYFYDTASKIDAGGWSTEYRIPFSSLRYTDAAEQQWNIIIWRNYPRDFRYAYQNVPIPRDSNCYICHAQPIVGLTGLPRAGHLVAAPYVTSQEVSEPSGDLGSPLETSHPKFDAGLDLKWTPTANQAIDLTIRPDFSQIESDVAQITVNQRFAVFYPEKRPFFLEGFDLFDTPMQVAYTRTITDPVWGARSTGKFLGSTYTILVTGDQGGGLTVIPGPLGSFFAPQDFHSIDTIARVRHDMGAGFVGAVLTDREIQGGGHNRVFGPDFQWRPSGSDSVRGEALISNNTNPYLPTVSSAWDGASSTDHLLYLGWNHSAQKFDWAVEGRDLGNQFRADLGFIPQNGFREVDGGFGYRAYPQHGLLNFIRTYINVDEQRDTANETILRQINPGLLLLGRKNLTVELDYRPQEQVFVGGHLLQQSYVPWFFQIDPSRRFPRITLQGRIGQFIDFANARVGTGGNYGVTATLRPIDRMQFDIIGTHEWLDARGDRVYTANVERLKTTYSFSARSLLRVIGQYVTNDSGTEHDGSFTGSVLYSFKLNWQTVLFLGYGDDRVLSLDNSLVRADRSLFFKVSYAIQR